MSPATGDATAVDPGLAVDPGMDAHPEPSPDPGPSLSPSRAADFMTCPLLYRFRVIDRLPEPPNLDAVRGTMIHTVLERLYDLPPGDRTMGSAVSLLEPEWERLLADTPELTELFADGQEPFDEWLAGARNLISTYFTLEDPQRLEPAERELCVETVLPSGLRLRGYVDRLDVAAASGDLRVVDYKTGKAPPVGFEQRPMFQMRFYALILSRHYERVPRLLQLLYLGSGEVLRYQPDAADLRATERKILALWDAIARATDRQDWRANPSRLCDWCAHRSVCPAWGGTPPPLPHVDAAAAASS